MPTGVVFTMTLYLFIISGVRSLYVRTPSLGVRDTRVGAMSKDSSPCHTALDAPPVPNMSAYLCCRVKRGSVSYTHLTLPTRSAV